jgi:hypothetical protein
MLFNIGFSLKFLIIYSPRHSSGATPFAKRGDGGESVKSEVGTYAHFHVIFFGIVLPKLRDSSAMEGCFFYKKDNLLPDTY